MQNLDKKLADEMKLSSTNGVYIHEVSAGGAADKAGLKKGDVIVAIDSVKVIDASSVQALVSKFHPGEKATISIVRDGKAKDVEVTFLAAAEEMGSVDEE